MLSCTRKFRFEAAHRLFKYDGPCANIHGHSYVVEVTVRERGGSTDQVDDLGILLDFGTIKKVIGSWIDDNWDHALILNNDDPLVEVECKLFDEMKFYLMRGNPTAENMAALLLQEGSEALGYLFVVSKVTVWETENCCATKEL